ncbi:Uncharacterized protein XB16_1353 [Leptospira santarosai]|uniref:Uncharacterized protein n=1 Tax=Leptospira santarosai TaxID=28183 RepID=A0A2P1QS00_9LEPT|nr:Uncharacterized protein XB16_1353 [Leptospira santarosai]
MKTISAIHLQELTQEYRQRSRTIPRNFSKCRARAEVVFVIARAYSKYFEEIGLPQEVSNTRRGRLIQAMKSKPDSVISAFKLLNKAHGKLSKRIAQFSCVNGEMPCSCKEVRKHRTNPSVYSSGRRERKLQ